MSSFYCLIIVIHMITFAQSIAVESHQRASPPTAVESHQGESPPESHSPTPDPTLSPSSTPTDVDVRSINNILTICNYSFTAFTFRKLVIK